MSRTASHPGHRSCQRRGGRACSRLALMVAVKSPSVTRQLSRLRPLAAALLGAWLAGCGGAGSLVREEAPPAATLAQLEPALVEKSALEPREVSIDEVIGSYVDLVELAEDPDVRMKGLQRLADLRLEKGETAHYSGVSSELEAAAGAYQGLLAEYPERIQNDRVRYQLAKTRDLQGDMEANLAVLNSLVLSHPDSPYLAESQFRRGDMLFSKGDFVGAGQAFDEVIASGEKQFLTNAHYMRGWCHFKLDDYRQALISFTAVLDQVLPSGFQMASLEEQNATLVEDLLRVMGFAFSYLGGAESIPELFAQTGPRPYEFLVYDRYAQLLTQQELYSDAIEVYRQYIERYPQSLYAPQYQVSIIRILAEAGFVSSILEEKARFVDVYGKDSEFWRATNPIDLKYTEARLEEYLPELAAIHYNLGQRAPAPSEAQKEFELAARYYAAYADTFPQQDKAAEMLFLLGESLGQLGRWQDGIPPWERAGYDYPQFERASEAAYASVLAHARVLESLPAEAATERGGSGSQVVAAAGGMTDTEVGGDPEAAALARAVAEAPDVRQFWKERQLRSRLRFVDFHGKDPRALEVLYLTAAELFAESSYTEVLGLSQRILDWQPPPSDAMQTDARLLRAHSYFALGDFLQAETAYQAVLDGMAVADERRKPVIESLAASVYRQGEQMLAAGNTDQAVSEFLRVGRVAPDADLRANAEFDAANLLIEQQRWEEATPVLVDFRKRYPGHDLTASIPGKLALAYQESGQVGLAAAEFALLVAASQDAGERRERLLITADLYDQAGDSERAIRTYTQYAEAYTLPAADYMEAVFRLAELHAAAGQTAQQRQWLEKAVSAHDRHAAEATDRMRFLAASAASVLADDSYRKFLETRLSLPLNQSLSRKTAAMKETMAAYQAIAGYGVAEFATLAGFRMGDLYAQLSRDLMASERPASLSDMEREQYDLLLEEQAYPFEENAIAIHEQNIQKSWNGLYDQWVRSSFDALARLLPARYGKSEMKRDVTDVIL